MSRSEAKALADSVMERLESRLEMLEDEAAEELRPRLQEASEALALAYTRRLAGDPSADELEAVARARLENVQAVGAIVGADAMRGALKDVALGAIRGLFALL